MKCKNLYIILFLSALSANGLVAREVKGAGIYPDSDEEKNRAARGLLMDETLRRFARKHAGEKVEQKKNQLARRFLMDETMRRLALKIAPGESVPDEMLALPPSAAGNTAPGLMAQAEKPGFFFIPQGRKTHLELGRRMPRWT